MFFPDDDFVSTSEICEEYGIDISIERADELRGAPEYGCFGLTERQYETVVSAYEHGYYDVPRKINQEELAEYFGISHQALSERLRRGHRNLIANTLFDAPEPVRRVP
jgi:predicted DNA binding protein